MPTATDCPCTSGRSYRDCCRSFHRNEREAETPELLMRSRFAAFVLKDADYLVRTMHADHEDRALPAVEIVRRFRTSATEFKYMGLQILDRRDADEDGVARVLFLARVFEKGRERSFVELSDFARDTVGWRYLSGKTIAVARMEGDPQALTIASFPI